MVRTYTIIVSMSVFMLGAVEHEAHIVMWTSQPRYRSDIAETVILSMATIAQTVLRTTQQRKQEALDSKQHTSTAVIEVGTAVIQGIAAVAHVIATADTPQLCKKCGKIHAPS